MPTKLLHLICLMLLFATSLSLSAQMGVTTGILTIRGTEQPVNGVWPSGVLSLTINGQTESLSYGQFSTSASIAAGFAARFSSDPIADLPDLCTQGLCAKANGSRIILEAEEQLSAQLNSSGFTAPFTLDSTQWPSLTVGPSPGGVTLAPKDGLFVKLVNMASQLCLDDTGAGITPGTTAQEWTCNGLSPQRWQLHDMGNGFWSLQNQNSLLCLDDPSGSSNPGTQLQQWTCNGLAPQNWQFVNAGNGYYTLQNQAANLMLDNPGGSTAPGTQVQLWSANGLAPQEWLLTGADETVGDLSITCTPSQLTQGAASTCTVLAPKGSVGSVQVSIDQGAPLTATLTNEVAVLPNALSGASIGRHIVVATTTQSGILLTATASVSVASTSSTPPTTVYGYAIVTPQGNTGYAANGNITAYADSVNGTWQNIAYDSLNRLTSAAQGSNSSTATVYNCWAYDSFGNRTIQAASDQSLTASTCAPASTATTFSASSMTLDYKNRVTGRSVASLQGSTALPALNYDASGNVTGDPSTNYSYVYDIEGQICAARTSNGWTGYLYDSDGHRVAKASLPGAPASCDPTDPNGILANMQGATLYMLGPDGDAMTEVQGGTWSRTHVFVSGSEVATYDPSGLHFQLQDWLGTRRVQTTLTGVPESEFTSQPFGDCLPGSNCGISVLDASDRNYTGKERDSESGLDYFGARYYAGSMGRWMSPDWAGKPEPIPYVDLTKPQTLNLYGYVGNNPLSRTDPDGHCTDGGKEKGFWWCLFNTSDQDAEQARTRLALYKNISINGKTPAEAAKGLSNQQTVDLDSSILNFIMNSMLSSKGTQLGLAIATFGAEGFEARIVSGIEAANGTIITGFTEHGVDRAIGDAAAGTPGARAGTTPQAILDAIKNPTKVTSGIDSQGRPFEVFTGKDARVVVNPSSGRIVSVNPLSGAGAH